MAMGAAAAERGAEGTDAAVLDRLRLIRSPRVGVVTYHRLLAEHGTAAAALAALPALAAAAGVTGYECCPPARAEAELLAGRRCGAQLMLHDAPGYPAALKALSDAPALLWWQGDAALLQRPLLAMVGARNASSLGVRMAQRLALALGEAGYVVVSGLARGIDSAAHQAALACGTIAVQAGGVDHDTPEETAALAGQIRAQGLCLSEQPPGLQPQAGHFPQRNRIISGLCRAVVVVEAAARSGSLITARSALDQGRDVLAVPGHPFDARAAGCNQLIRDGALLVRGVRDVLEALGQPASAPGAAAVPGPARSQAAEYDREHDRAHDRGNDREHDRAHDWAHRTALGAAPISAPPPQLARNRAASGRAGAAPAPLPRRDLRESHALHALILARLTGSPTGEDHLMRELALPPSLLLPELLSLELEGRIRRQPGGLLSRL